MGFALVPDACKNFNPLIKMLFEGSGVAIAAALSVFLNVILPKEKTSIAEEKIA